MTNFLSNWTFKLADDIDITTFVDVSANIDANIFVATNSLVDSVVINIPPSTKLALALSVVSVISDYMQQQATNARFDQLDEKLNKIIKQLFEIQQQVDHIENLMNEALEKIDEITKDQRLSWAQTKRNELVSAFAQVRKKRYIWEAGDDLEGAKVIRGQIEDSIFDLASNNYFMFYKIVGIGLVVIRDLTELINDSWDMRPVVREAISFYKKALKPEDIKQKSKRGLKDSFPQLEFSAKYGFDELFKPNTSLAPVTWIGKTDQAYSKERSDKHGGLGTVIDGKLPWSAYYWQAEFNSNQFLCELHSGVKLDPNSRYNLRRDDKTSFRTVYGPPIMMGHQKSPDISDSTVWTGKGKFRLYALMEVGEKGVQLSKLFYHPSKIKSFRPTAKVKGKKYGLIRRGELPEIGQYATSWKFNKKRHHKFVHNQKTFPIPGVKTIRHANGINGAVTEGNKLFGLAIESKASSIAVGHLLTSAEELLKTLSN